MFFTCVRITVLCHKDNNYAQRALPKKKLDINSQNITVQELCKPPPTPR